MRSDSDSVLTLLPVVAETLASMIPVAATPPTVISIVSSDSSMVSLAVGTLTGKLVTPAGTVILPPLKVTPLLNVGVLVKSVPAAVFPAMVKQNVVVTAASLLKVHV